jgi:hypothetical protein
VDTHRRIGALAILDGAHARARAEVANDQVQLVTWLFQEYRCPIQYGFIREAAAVIFF